MDSKEIFLNTFDLKEERESSIKFIEEESNKMSEAMAEAMANKINIQIKPKPKFIPMFFWKYLIKKITYLEIKNENKYTT